MTLHKQTVTVRPKSSSGSPEQHGSDEHGDPIYATAPPIILKRCGVSPIALRAATNTGEVAPSTGRWRVSTHVGDLHPEIEPYDDVEWQGDTYKVQGLPETFHDIRAHTEFFIIRSTG
jgi:hypothetical protein